MRVPPLLILAAAGLTAATALATPAAAESHADTRFIITVADAYDSRAVAQEHRRKGADIDFVYTAALNGFAGSMSEAELGELQRDRRVTRIERDGIARTSGTQSNATWGLDRIDARSGLDGTYTYTPTGTGVNAYIIDTGIRSTHSDFGLRVTDGFTSIADGGGTEDCNGHGTHVAGTVGGTLYGVAKQVSLVPVRVLDCAGSGTWSGVIAGVDWVTANHQRPAVANMSLGGGASTSVDDAVANASNAGVTMVVAAGNGDRAGREQDACNYSPARVPDAVTIGATTSTDAKTSWSNYGDCVDLFAPGASITSAWYTGDTDTNTISGTSMAAPHVAGVAALYLQNNTGATALQVRDAIYNTSTKGVVSSSSTANNHLVYSPLTSDTVVTDGTVSGTVTSDADGTAIAGALVSAGGSSDSTDELGRYEITLPPGTYEVTTSASGYVTETAAGVVVESGKATTFNVGLAVSATTSSITLSANAYKLKGTKTVDLTWTGASSTSVDVYRDAKRVATTANDGAYRDSINTKGGGTYTYKLCEAGSTTTCSNAEAVTF